MQIFINLYFKFSISSIERKNLNNKYRLFSMCADKDKCDSLLSFTSKYNYYHAKLIAILSNAGIAQIEDPIWRHVHGEERDD